jgi:hypothetical protein
LDTGAQRKTGIVQRQSVPGATLVEARRIRPSGGPITIGGLSPGAYTIDVVGADPASPFAPVSSDILIWESRQAEPSTG